MFSLFKFRCLVLLVVCIPVLSFANVHQCPDLSHIPSGWQGDSIKLKPSDTVTVSRVVWLGGGMECVYKVGSSQVKAGTVHGAPSIPQPKGSKWIPIKNTPYYYCLPSSNAGCEF